MPALLLALSASGAYAQGSRIQLTVLDKLEAKADQVVDVNVDERLIKLAIKFLDVNKPNERRVREIVAALKGVYVKSYDFRRHGQYSLEDVEPIRAQLRSPAWVRVASVRSLREGQNVEVFTYLEGENISGIAVIAAEEERLTVVNIVGPIDVEKLAELGGHFNIPELKLDFGTKSIGRQP